jgi:hypothetical protein
VTKLRSAFFLQPQLPARVLATLLLALVLHGSTVGLAHSHGRSTPPRAVSSGPTTTSFAPARDFSNTKRPNCECLICQLQQNLSVTHISETPRFDAALMSRTYQPPSVRSYSSEPPTQGQGRAPPPAFLN